MQPTNKEERMQQDRQGFTLLELMMVVVIIGILATIALPQYFRSAERARVAEATTILSTVRSSQQRYKAQSPSNIYADNPSDLDVELPSDTQMTAWQTLTLSATTNNVTLTRKSGTPCATVVIQMDLDNGKMCAPVTNGCNQMWGVEAEPC